MMQPQVESSTMDDVAVMRQSFDGPSADFICKVSQFLDTDPSDMLSELGYYLSDEESQVS